MSTADVINVFQVMVALAIIGIVLLQAKGQGLGNIFGGGGETYRTRRGVERVLFRTTIVLMAAFVVLSIAAVRAAA
jgi:protein translocase SecG subunit